MSDVVIGGNGDASGGGGRLFAPVTVAVLLAVGIASFVAMVVLGAFAPDLKGSGSGGGHALSDAVHGFSGLVRLAEATGRRPRIVRDTHLYSTEDLVVATPERGSVQVGPVIDRRGSTPTLLVLPKWPTVPDAGHRGWVRIDGLTPVSDPAGTLSPAATLDVIHRRSAGRPLRIVEPGMSGIIFLAPQPLQAIRPSSQASRSSNGGFGTLQPLIVDEDDNIVVGRFSNRPLYIVADPDLLDNRGTHDAHTARSALELLDWMNSNEAKGIAFDVTLNGFSHGSSPLKLLFQPPFLATTLTLAAAVLLAVLGTLARFGSPRSRERAIAFGKSALVDNTAALVRKAGREARFGGRYVEVVREAAARALGAPARLRGAALDAYLDRAKRGERFTTLAGAVTRAENKDELVSTARALHDWMGERDT